MLELVNLARVAPPAPVTWLWAGRVPLGCLSLLGGPPGVGKSSLVAALEVAVAAGQPFLEAATQPGAVIHADFDTDLRLQYPWYARAALAAPLGIERLWDGEAVRFEVYDLGEFDAGGSGLTRARRALLETLRDTASLPREALLERVAARAGVSGRTVERALGAVLAEGEVEALAQSARGSPRHYRLLDPEAVWRESEAAALEGMDSPPPSGEEPRVRPERAVGL